MFREFKRSVNIIYDNVIELVYFMRGSVGYEEMLRRSPFEREKMSDFIEKRIESESKSTHPVY